ncbi:hypothetical protein C2G38_2164010 [Gigaspora rosea]|uniref:Uncharacterized protein n=1 Tax=Gigaspora rosea TaxID=44941 RepID=A0A397VW31_9GLOM|nr:hypothetical protein C2G38_2164010 [Gigaspora rosea]
MNNIFIEPINPKKRVKVEKRVIGRDIWIRERNLLSFEDHKSLLDEDYHICDPWVQSNDGCPQPNDGESPQLNNGGEKKIILLIGKYTVQVWYEREKKKRSLEFISVVDEGNPERCLNKFCKKFRLSSDFKDSQSIEMWSDNYVIDAVTKACHTLKYLYKMRKEQDKHDALLTYEHRYLKYKEITKQTQNIIMITVSEILPDLYNETKENYGFYKSYAQLLFYKRCFCSKGLDIPFFKFIKIPPCITSNNNSLEVFIPVTQLIPKDCKLEINEINCDKIPDIQMVPLIDFTTNKKILLEKRGDKYLNNLRPIFCPSKFVSLEECPIPFRLIDKVVNNRKDSFYYNPSIEAIMNFMFVFLGYVQYIGLSQTSTTYEVSNGSEEIYNMTGIELGNSFSNPFRAIIAAYYWSSNSFDVWGFWPLIIITFEDANKDGKRAVLNFQSRLIYDYALCENSAFTSKQNDFDCKFNNKLKCKRKEETIKQTTEETEEITEQA